MFDDTPSQALEYARAMNEATLHSIRMDAARMEREAAQIRFDTAQAEAQSACQTLAMADAVARAMYEAQMGRPFASKERN